MNSRTLRDILAKFIFDRCFQFWENHGIHITHVDCYSPIPDTRELTDAILANESELPGLDLNLDTQLDLLTNTFPRFKDEYDTRAQKADNPMGITNALVLYCTVRHFQPRLIIEVGSGYSTQISSLATTRNGIGDIICIDPYPDEKIRGLPRVMEVIPRRVQDIDWHFFEQLGDGDILFIDTTHTVKCGGDVNYLCLEVLPRLHKGVLIHFHDIFLPREYPRQWVTNKHRFWNEQYLLQALLMFSSGFDVLFMTSFMELKYRQEMKRAFPNSPEWEGGSCWIRKK